MEWAPGSIKIKALFKIAIHFLLTQQRCCLGMAHVEAEML